MMAVQKIIYLAKYLDDYDTATSGQIYQSQLRYCKDIKILEEMITILLNSGCNAKAFDYEGCTPIYYAAEQGLYSVICKLISNEKDTEKDTLFKAINWSKQTLLQATIIGMKKNSVNPVCNFDSCLDLFLNYSKINVNHYDVYGNTALHYAAKNGDVETILKLLRHGACVSKQNNDNRPPLADINAKILETYLDECIMTNDIFNTNQNDKNCEIFMKYHFLVDPKYTHEDPYKEEDESNKEVEAFDPNLALETDGLLYMSQNKELRPLLKHPVITSFLYLKWQRIKFICYANITFYSLLWLCLTLYIILDNGVTKKQSILHVVTHIGTIIGLIFLIIREFLQLLLSPVIYLKSVENLIEIALICIIALIVSKDSTPVSTKQQLSAVAILISSAELLLLIGQLPGLSTNIVMLKTVSLTFFKFLLGYCVLIIAFALSFYTLFREVKEDPTPPPQSLNSADEELFNDPFTAIFKTIVMLTGEFDAGSIQFNTFPVTSHIIFIMFVFMIPIVLFNLLNGLAVSDTQKIRSDAELVGLISKVKLIYYLECVLIGNTQNFKYECLWDLYTLILFLPRLCLQPFVKHIYLFPFFLPEYEIIVRVNQGNK